MPASVKDDEIEGKAGTPASDIDAVEDDDFVEVNEDGSPVQDAAATSATDDDESDDDDGEGDTDTDDKATLERKRKKAAQREASKLRRQLAAQSERQEAIERELVELRAERLERASGAVQERVTAAEQALETALEDGDAKGIVAAQRALAKVEAEAGEWKRTVTRPAPRASAPASNPLVEQFVAKHDTWFDPAGGDFDSDTVIRLSAAIATEGLAPESKQHFAELDRRMERYLPHRVGGAKPRPRATSAAPSSGRGGESAMRGKVAIPRATINGYREAFGIDWDDPDPDEQAKARAKIIKGYTDSQRARGERA